MEKKVETQNHGTKKGTHMKAHPKHDKIHEALNLLNEVAQEKKGELWETIVDKYAYVRDMVHGVTEEGLETANAAKKDLLKSLQAKEKELLVSVSKIDKQVREDPWKVVGGVALVSLIAGIFLGRRK